MIEVRKSNIGNNKPHFHTMQNLAYNMYCLSNKDKKIFFRYVELAKEVNRRLRSFQCENSDLNRVSNNIRNSLKSYSKLAENKGISIKHFISNIEKSYNNILATLNSLDVEDISNVRGLLTECVCLSFLGEVRHPNNNTLVWDCCFFENNIKITSPNKEKPEYPVTSTDIYNETKNDIELYECKTRPDYINESQVEFLRLIRSKYKENQKTSQLYVFILEDGSHPSLDSLYQDIDDYIPNFSTDIKLVTINVLKNAI